MTVEAAADQVRGLYFRLVRRPVLRLRTRSRKMSSLVERDTLTLKQELFIRSRAAIPDIPIEDKQLLDELDSAARDLLAIAANSPAPGEYDTLRVTVERAAAAAFEGPGGVDLSGTRAALWTGAQRACQELRAMRRQLLHAYGDDAT